MSPLYVILHQKQLRRTLRVLCLLLKGYLCSQRALFNSPFDCTQITDVWGGLKMGLIVFSHSCGSCLCTTLEWIISSPSLLPLNPPLAFPVSVSLSNRITTEASLWSTLPIVILQSYWLENSFYHDCCARRLKSWKKSLLPGKVLRRDSSLARSRHGTQHTTLDS